jgi:hypothetical protein
MAVQTKLITAEELERMPFHDKHVELVTVTVYRSPTDVSVLTAQGRLDGEQVIPSFAIPLREIFE